MEREPEEKSLFETAAETLGSKKRKKKGGPTTPGPRQPVPDKDVTRRKKETAQKVPQDPEIRDMVGQIKTMQDDLKSRFDQLYVETGMNEDQLKTFMDNPKNFLPADWEFLQKNKNVLEEKVWNAVGEELKPKPQSAVRSSRTNPNDERKGKTLGARKKWLDMH